MQLAPKGYFLSRLVAVAGLFLLPLLALHAYTLYREFADARSSAIKSVQGQSADTKREVDSALVRAENLLHYLAMRDELQHADAASCSKLLKDLSTVDPLYLNVGVIALDGRRLCIATEGAGGPAPGSFANAEWFPQLSQAQDLTLAGPFAGRVAPTPIAILGLPVRDAAGARIALVGITIRLVKLAESLKSAGLPAGSSVTLMSAGNRVLARVPDFQNWVGRAAPIDTIYRQEIAERGFATAKGIDGVERMFAAQEIPRYGLRISAGVPTESILGPIVNQAIKSAILAAMVVALGSVLAARWAQGLTRPFRILRSATRDVASGRAGVRVSEDLPGEFRDLAQDFNQMASALERTMTDLRHSTDHSVKLTRLYEALSATNQAITQAKPRDELLQEICDLCVNTGHATMAWIGLKEGANGTAIAASGRAREYLELAGKSFKLDDPAAAGPIGEAARTGKPYVANDFLTDPHTVLWRDIAAQFGVKASASFPFRQGDEIAGVLNLYVDEADFFDDQVLQLLEEIATDVSYALDTAESEKARAEVQSALERRELQLTGYVESARDAIVTTDKTRRILTFNKAACALFGVTEAEALGAPIARFLPLAAQPGQEEYVAYLHGSEQMSSAVPIALTGVRKDGSRVPLEVSFSHFGEPGKRLRTFVMRDASLLREAQQALVAQAEAVAANWAKTNFLSKMSHELRTPLNAVIGFSGLLHESAWQRLTPQEAQQVELIHLAGAQLLALVEDVLDVSRIEAGHVLITLQDVDLIEELDVAITLSQAAANSSDVKLLPEYRKRGPLNLRTDPVRLRQVMLNLLSNGVKYNKRGGSVTVDIRLEPERLHICVDDTGLGMTVEQLSGLFQPFNRLGRENTTIVGTGLGMALTRQLVELMGGGIEVSSTPGVGTFFKVSLPYVAAQEGDGAPVLSAPLPAKQANVEVREEPAGVVLYIEDNLVNVLLVQQMLRLWTQVQVLVAEDGASGLKLLSSTAPDVVLLDMHLPDISGLEVLHAIRDLPASANLPVIALSASAMTQEVAQATEAGANDYWTKPLDVEVFRRNIAALLRTVSVRSARNSGFGPLK
jgi:PAS domain S-box-containing protein